MPIHENYIPICIDKDHANGFAVTKETTFYKPLTLKIEGKPGRIVKIISEWGGVLHEDSLGPDREIIVEVSDAD